MYRCLKCNGVYDSNELIRTAQYRGEYQGIPAFETERSCPKCSYDVEYCGEWYDGKEGDRHGREKGNGDFRECARYYKTLY